MVLTLYKVVLTLEFVDEVLIIIIIIIIIIIKRNRSNEGYITEHYTLLLWYVYNPPYS